MVRERYQANQKLNRRSSRLKKKSILIIENYTELAKTFSLILQKNGYSTDTAETTIEALEKIRNNQYSTVLIDDEPPNINTSLILQELNKQKTVKIVITDHPEKAVSNGADACINKIVKMDELILLLLTKEKLRRK